VKPQPESHELITGEQSRLGYLELMARMAKTEEARRIFRNYAVDERRRLRARRLMLPEHPASGAGPSGWNASAGG
jgi:hypothetical protein